MPTAPEILVNLRLDIDDYRKKQAEARRLADEYAQKAAQATGRAKGGFASLASQQEKVYTNSKKMADMLQKQASSVQQSITATNQLAAAQGRLAASTQQATAAVGSAAAAHAATTARKKEAAFYTERFSRILGTTITVWYTFRTIVYAVKSAIEGVLNIYKLGAQVLDDYNQKVIGIATLQAPLVKEGAELSDKFAISLAYQKDMMAKLDVESIKHFATAKDMQEVYQQLAVSGVWVNEKDLDLVGQLTDKIRLYTVGQNQSIQLHQEIRGLIEGETRTTNKLANMLNTQLNGTLKEHLEIWRAAGRDIQTGELVMLREIMKLLGPMTVAEKEIMAMQITWVDTLTTYRDRLLRSSVKEYYKDVVGYMSQAVNLIVDPLTGETTRLGKIIEDTIVQGWRKAKEILGGVFKKEVYDTKQAVTELAEAMNKMVKEFDAKGFGERVRNVFDGIKSSIDAVTASLEALAVMMGVNLVFSLGKWLLSWKGAISLIIGGIILTRKEFVEANKRAEEWEWKIRSGAEATRGLAYAEKLYVDQLQNEHEVKMLLAKQDKKLPIPTMDDPKKAKEISDAQKRLNAEIERLQEENARWENDLIEDRVTKLEAAANKEVAIWQIQLDKKKISLDSFNTYVEEKTANVADKVNSIYIEAAAKAGDQLEKHEETLVNTINRQLREIHNIYVALSKKGYEGLELLPEETEFVKAGRQRGLPLALMEYEPDYIRELEKKAAITKDQLDAAQKAKRDRDVEITKANEIKHAQDLAAELMDIQGYTFEAEKERAWNELQLAETLYRGKTDLLKMYRDKYLLTIEEINQREQMRNVQTIGQISNTMQQIGQILATSSKKYFKFYQAMSISTIIIDTARAIMGVFAAKSEVPPWLRFPLAAAMAGLGGAQIGQIMAQKPAELAEGGVSPGGFSSMAERVYSKPTYVMAEKTGRPEAVVPLDKWDVSKKGKETPVSYTYQIYAIDAKSFAEFADRNSNTFRRQLIRAVQENDPGVRGAIKNAVR